MALDDARMDFTDVQQAFCSRVYPPRLDRRPGHGGMGRTGISCPDIEAACAAAAVGSRQAVMMVESGQCDVAPGVRCREDAERASWTPGRLYEPWMCQTGLTQNPQYWALNANAPHARLRHDRAATGPGRRQGEEERCSQPVTPSSGSRLTVEEILASPLVADPLRLIHDLFSRRWCWPRRSSSTRRSRTRTPPSRSRSPPACTRSSQLPALTTRARICVTPTGNPSVYRATAEAAYEQAGLGPCGHRRRRGPGRRRVLRDRVLRGARLLRARRGRTDDRGGRDRDRRAYSRSIRAAGCRRRANRSALPTYGQIYELVNATSRRGGRARSRARA